jgi:hypothetical protein
LHIVNSSNEEKVKNFNWFTVVSKDANSILLQIICLLRDPTGPEIIVIRVCSFYVHEEQRCSKVVSIETQVQTLASLLRTQNQAQAFSLFARGPSELLYKVKPLH